MSEEMNEYYGCIYNVREWERELECKNAKGGERTKWMWDI